MNTQLEFLNPRNSFEFERKNTSGQETHTEQHVDVDKLELLICLEVLLTICYQNIEWFVHNKIVRQECQQLEKHAQYRQKELRKIITFTPQNEVAIESKVNQYLLQLKPSYLSLREIINLSINLNVFKIYLYKYFCRNVQEYHEVLNSFLQDNVEERCFLVQERNFHQNRVNPYLNN